MTTARGQRPGPTLALLGGVHGDEDEGVLAVLQVLHELRDAELAGTVRAVAPAHPAAWAAASRTSPLDGADLARSFPGDGGSQTAAIAAGLTDGVIADADLLVDLHSAGRRYRMPLFCGFVQWRSGAEQSERAALAFGAPLVWAHSAVAPGRSVSVAIERGIPAIYAESSGGGSIRSDQLEVYVRGVLSVLAEFGMLPAPFRRRPVSGPRWVYDGGDLDAGVAARHDGLFVSTVNAGAVVGSGEEVGRLYSYAGELLETITTPSDGMVMFLRRQARTRAGEVLFALGRVESGAVG
ncbi:succinylglutamate desuccinylase/aspartoacylase family protein [Jiangella muralis]|uniref:succinylglutamate desuccinylase/aspartoacylase family protein n=1 Tax=Jiangella muralis TaxID=702383 RepID=UPI001F0AA9E8|nr:succinylglutamate desuccinylase/aspartoacylase family protein [Jiangella muralis]